MCALNMSSTSTRSVKIVMKLTLTLWVLAGLPESPRLQIVCSKTKWVTNYNTHIENEVYPYSWTSNHKKIAEGVRGLRRVSRFLHQISKWLNFIIPFRFLYNGMINIFVNDQPKVISRETSLPLFADDSRSFRWILGQDDCDKLQDGLNELFNWSCT